MLSAIVIQQVQLRRMRVLAEQAAAEKNALRVRTIVLELDEVIAQINAKSAATVKPADSGKTPVGKQ
jgi:hypothetical protein